GALTDRLKTAGFRVRVEKVPSLLDTREAGVPAGFQVHWGAAARETAVADAFRKAVAEVIHAAGIDAGFALEAGACFCDGGTDVGLYYPVRGVAAGTLADRLADPGRFRVKLHCAEKDEWADLVAELGKWGFASVEAEVGDRRLRKRVEFGGAPGALVER